MGLAREGIREMFIATVVLAAVAWGLSLWHWAAVLPAVAVWLWSIAFFRDPRRAGKFAPGEMCAPADGTVTEISHLEHHDAIGGPAIRVGLFLSIFNVHINRSPCAGEVVSVTYQPGKFLDARHPDSGSQNEANTLVMRVAEPHVGPVVVRQVSGKIARRIICHPQAGTTLNRGERFGLIKFGSRTELIVPAAGADIAVALGDKVKAGLTVMLRQTPIEGDV